VPLLAHVRVEFLIDVFNLEMDRPGMRLYEPSREEVGRGNRHAGGGRRREQARWTIAPSPFILLAFAKSRGTRWPPNYMLLAIAVHYANYTRGRDAEVSRAIPPPTG